jgi:Bacterial Ig-like domain (group 1)
MTFTRRRFRAFTVLAFAAASIACTLETDVNGPGGLIKYSGDLQTVTTNTPLAAPLTVLVVTQFGERLKNVTVNWTIESGGGSLSAASSLTDEAGLASVDYTSGSTTGEAVIRAQVHGVPPLRFHITIG